MSYATHYSPGKAPEQLHRGEVPLQLSQLDTVTVDDGRGEEMCEPPSRVAERGETDDGSHYYDHWLAALEALAIGEAMTTKASPDARKAEWRDA